MVDFERDAPQLCAHLQKNSLDTARYKNKTKEESLFIYNFRKEIVKTAKAKLKGERKSFLTSCFLFGNLFPSMAIQHNTKMFWNKQSQKQTWGVSQDDCAEGSLIMMISSPMNIESFFFFRDGKNSSSSNSPWILLHATHESSSSKENRA